MDFLIGLIILVLIFAVVFWLLKMVLPDPKVQQIATVFLALVFLIYLLMVISGRASFPFP